MNTPNNALSKSDRTERIDQTVKAAILEISSQLISDLPRKARCDHIVSTIRKALNCDSVVLMSYENDFLTPISVQGLSAEVIGKRFKPQDHPRLQAILDAKGPLRFAEDDPRSDPYDGLMASDTAGKMAVHACMGAPLYVKNYIAGIITLDAIQPDTFRQVDDWSLSILVALAAASLRIGRLIDTLEEQAERRGMVTKDLVAEALKRGGKLMGESPIMEQLIQEVEIVSHSDLSVLICGETGTGKEIVARTIHAHSPRSGQPLVYVNCAALPEQIAESELFGHIRGAFTGANRDRSGKFELADKGTLLLDEVGELPLQLQAKLLRAIQFGEIQRVGEDRNTSVDVRIIASTNRDLEEEVSNGHFRADLYHRLNVYPLKVPTLEQRREDIPLLTGHFLDQARIRLGCKEMRMSPPALSALSRYPWPGNVRELEHVIMRAALRAASEARDPIVIVKLQHINIDGGQTAQGPIPDTIGNIPMQGSYNDILDQFQRQLITSTIQQTENNWSRAAKELQMDRSNLHRLAKRLGIKK